MDGDPDAARFRGPSSVKGDPEIHEGFLSRLPDLTVIPSGEKWGQALPAMLAEGWRVVSVSPGGGEFASAYALLERDEP